MGFDALIHALENFLNILWHRQSSKFQMMISYLDYVMTGMKSVLMS